MDLEFKGKYIITGKLICETGLHIGGAVEGFEIGGLDNPVIKDSLTDYPYIPGSALKGKLRHLLEWSLGKNTYTDPERPFHFKKGKTSKGEPTFNPCDCGRCEACVLFGTTPEDGVKKKGEKDAGFASLEDEYTITGPSRLTVRDSFPTEQTLAKWKQYLGEKIYTELKTENALDRVTAEANPRTMERVPAGSEFSFEMIVDIYREKDKELISKLFEAMLLLENSALGGQGTRGHGKVKFADVKIAFRSLDYYQCKMDSEDVRCECHRDNRDKPDKPAKFKISGKITEEVPYQESLVKFLGKRLDKILG